MAERALVAHDPGSYDQIEQQFQAAMDESLHPVSRGLLYELAAELSLPAGAAALDVGCGTGRHSIELARRLGLAVRGIDPGVRRLGIAAQELERRSADQPGLRQLVSFAAGTAQNLPVADHSVDLVWCRDVLCLVEQLGAVYAEFRRVLKPGGRALVYQMFSTDRLEPAEAAWLLPAMGCIDASMRPETTEEAITDAGLRLDQCVIVAGQWHEYAQEQTGAPGRDLLHAARLLRDPARYISQFGEGNYEVALGDCIWHIYQMIGKLSGRIYLLTAPPAA